MGACCSTREGKDRRPKPIVKAVSAKSRVALENLKKKTAEMEAFVRKTIEAGKPWTDPEFPPERSSLYDPNIDDVDRKTFNSYSWKRASQIYKQLYIFEDGIEPNDIN